MTYAVRDLTPLDYEQCLEMIQEPFYAQLFATKQLDDLHQQCSYATVAVNSSDNTIAAFLIAAHSPQFFADLPMKSQPGSPPGTRCPVAPSSYVQSYYEAQLPEFTSQYGRAFGSLPEHPTALNLLIKCFFNYDPYNEALLFVQHPYQSLPVYAREVFPELQRTNPLPSGCCSYLCCLRDDVLAPLLVRPSEMKDHDDLVLIFEAQNTNLREKYGEFFVADLITGAQEEPAQKIALVGLDFESPGSEIRKPVSFMYAEKFSPFNEEDAQILQNLQVTHMLERYGMQSVPPDCISFIRATATLPQAESRCTDLINAIFEQWEDVEALLLSLPSSATCTDMQILRLFTLVDPRSPLSPRESLFVCHRSSSLNTINVQSLQNQDQLEAIKHYVLESLQHQNLINSNAEFYQNLEILQPDSTHGAVVAFGWNDGKKVPVAVAVCDLTVGCQQDAKILKNYIEEYETQALQKSEGRICHKDVKVDIESKYYETKSIWDMAECLQCKTWCKIHYDEPLEKFAYLRGLIIDPLYIQFKDQILSSFLRQCGTDGFLLSVNFKQQQFIKQVYKAEQFVSFDADPNSLFTQFEKELFRSSDFIENVRILPDPFRTFYDGQIGSNYGAQPKPPPQNASCANSMYGPESELHKNRKEDEAAFNLKSLQDQQADVALAAIRALQPKFSLFVLRPLTQMTTFVPPVSIANSDEPQKMIIKPPVTLTDRLVIIGNGMGLLHILATLQDCHHIAKFKTISIIHPAPGILTPYNFENEQSYPYDHGESLTFVRNRCVQLFYDVFIGDMQEVDLQNGVIKLASGSEISFDLLLICPDGADSESLRACSFFNLNSAVSFNYGVVDPSEQSKQVGLFQAGSTISQINDRGYKDQDICQVLCEPKNYMKLLSSLYTEFHTPPMNLLENKQKEEDKTKIKSPQRLPVYTAESDTDLLLTLRARLHARTFFRFLTQDKPLMKRQVAALYSSTYLQNFNWCAMNLISTGIRKQLEQQKEKKSEQDEDKENNQETADESKPTAQLNGYRTLSPGAKTSQFIQILNPSVYAELPLIISRISQIITEACKQLFPSLYDPRPPRAGKAMSTQSVASTIIDAARTSVCVYGDTFEAFSIVQSLIDAGVPPCSIVLLLPQDPNADIEPASVAQENLIEFLMGNQGVGKLKARESSLVPQILGKIGTAKMITDEKISESKSTAQNAEKRTESFPIDLHRAILNQIQLLGVNVEKNVKIVDVLSSINGTSQKTLGRGNDEEGNDNQSENESDEEEFSDEDDNSEEEVEELDDTKEITVEMIENSLEKLQELDERDVVFYKKFPGFGEEFEKLDEICDLILLGDTDKVLATALGDGDANFDVSDLSAQEKTTELQILLRKRIYKLSQVFQKFNKKKYGSMNPETGMRTNSLLKKCQNGGSLCGLRVQLLVKNEDNIDQKSNIPMGNSNLGRLYYGPNGTNIRMTVQQGDSQLATPTNNKDIYCCAIFLTETFSVPNNISSAIMKSDLVFDKALIVNSFAQTSDPRVYAAGNIGKLSRATLLRRMNTEVQRPTPTIPFSPVLLTQDPVKPVVTWSLYSVGETAQYASYKLITRRLQNFGETTDNGLVPEFTKPLVLSAKIPGGHIFRVSRPLRDIRDLRIATQKLFRVIETGDLNNIDETSRWCRLEIDPMGIVDSFTVFGGRQLSCEYKSLVYDVVGMPIALYDQLESRWQRDGGVNDIIDFLCQYHVQALFNKQITNKLNEIIVDLNYFSQLQDNLEKVKTAVPNYSRGIADIKEDAFTKDYAQKILYDNAGKEKIQKMLVNVAKDFANKFSDRFPEINKDVDTRGIVSLK